MNKKGFTLIELLAVIIILGILMIIAIPSVTRYISDSRKSVYIDTAHSLISGARNMVNEGKLQMFDTDTTYYINAECIKTEGANKSPYGEFVKAYVVVTYDGKGYEYYWTSIDEVGNGIKKITRIDKLTEESVESDLITSDIVDTYGIDGRSQYMIIDKENTNCGRGEAKDISGNVSGEDGNVGTPAAQTINNIDSLVNIADANRYVGSSPSNYVKFNGNELWRIIGVYGNKLKIIKNTNIGNISYNSTNEAGNNWNETSLKIYLNGDYYNSMDSVAKNMIYDGQWFIGKTKAQRIASEAYNDAKTSTITSKVGLMASYEFLYAADSSCYNVSGYDYHSTGNCGLSSWLRSGNAEWTISAHMDWSSFAVVISSDGMLNNYNVPNTFNVRPVVYLKSSVKIVSGNGSYNDPYILE